MSLLPAPSASISALLPYIVEDLRENKRKNDKSIDEILTKERKALTNKYINDIQKDFHTNDLNEAYTKYKQDAQPIIQEINNLKMLARNSNFKVQDARINSGSNSDEQVSASSAASNAKIRMNQLVNKLKARGELYEKEKKDADIKSAAKLINFLDLPVLTKSGGVRTRKRRSKSRKTRRKA